MVAQVHSKRVLENVVSSQNFDWAGLAVRQVFIFLSDFRDHVYVIKDHWGVLLFLGVVTVHAYVRAVISEGDKTSPIVSLD